MLTMDIRTVGMGLWAEANRALMGPMKPYITTGVEESKSYTADVHAN